ncbi:MAG: bifunctional phosphoribosyl-AMP cyclohydrolase/phosphoribosyl-ATP diphosphatase HisIE [Gemmatimonadetes bacterium]|nr:bifunctional phosphoribosyl-AMP cyclohydrolase/phosphoribosyl-ATP diphosphatase HisIE [Gemmatimonadota bacterium]
MRSVADIAKLRFDPRDDLIPVIAQDAATGDVLMVAFADRAALEHTLATGEMHYHSRSRGELWRKGETSGNVQRVRELLADCDGDAILALVDPAGPACHTGTRTCFAVEREPSSTLAELWRVIEERAAQRPEGSYTTRLLENSNLRLKKLGEEMAELIAALASRDSTRVSQEAADLLYHLLVALRAADSSLAAVEAELARRRANQQVSRGDAEERGERHR